MVEFRRNNVLTDPTTVQLLARAPSGTQTTYTFGVASTPPIVKDAVGKYSIEIPLVAGEWEFQWVATGIINLVTEIESLRVEPNGWTEPRFSELTIPTTCGAWFAPPAFDAPCCGEHARLALRPGCDPPDSEPLDCAEPSTSQLADMTTALLRAAWGPAYPGWLCGTARLDLVPAACAADLSWSRTRYPTTRYCGPPMWIELPEDRFQCAAIAVAVNGVAVLPANMVVLGGNRIGYKVSGAPSAWPAALITATYRYGAVPPGAWLPWSRLFCQIRRTYRPREALASDMPVLNHVRGVSTSGAQVQYSDEEIKQGLLGWDPVVSAFATAGIAQLKSSAADIMGGAWAPQGRAGVARMEPLFPSMLLEA